MDSSRQIKLGAMMSYVAIVFNIIAGLLYTPWMVRQIGKSDYGLYVLVTSFLTYFIMDFGLGQAIARFIARYRAEKAEQKTNQLLGLTSKLYLWINLVVLVILVGIYFFIENIFIELSPVEILKFKTIYCIAGLFSLISFPFTPLNGILIAYERFMLLKLCDVISKVGTIICMVIALYLGYKLYALVAINALVGILIIVLKLVYLNKTTTIKIDFKYKSKELSKELFGFSIWVTVVGIAQRLLINLAPTLLGVFSGTTQIAIFSIGIIMEGYVWTFANALNGLFLPKVAALTSIHDNREEVTNLMIRVGRLQLIMVGLLFVGLICLGKEFIMLWMGPDFSESYLIVLFLILPSFFTLTQEIALTLLYVENEVKYKAILFISASIVSIVIGSLLIPTTGALGAAIGISIALFLFHVIGMNIVYVKIMKLNILLFFKECYLKMALPLGLSFAAGWIINYYIPAPHFVLFGLKAVLLSLVYIFVMWFFGLNNNEKEIFRSTIRRIISLKK